MSLTCFIRLHLVKLCHIRRVEVTRRDRMWWRASAFLWACYTDIASNCDEGTCFVTSPHQGSVLTVTTNIKEDSITWSGILLKFMLDNCCCKILWGVEIKVLDIYFYKQWKRKQIHFKLFVGIQTHPSSSKEWVYMHFMALFITWREQSEALMSMLTTI